MSRRRNQKVMTLDIETAPAEDIDVYMEKFENHKIEEWHRRVADFQAAKEAGLTEKGAKTPAKPKLKSNEASLNWVTSQICCIGTMVVDPGNVWRDVNVLASADEIEVLDFLRKILKENSDIAAIITFNGSSFDYPCLVHRAAKHKIPLLKYITLDRYGRARGGTQIPHIDIYEKLGGRWIANASLREYAIHYGLDHHMMYRGYEMQGFFERGEFKKIEEHCAGDNKVTAGLFRILYEVLV